MRSAPRQFDLPCLIARSLVYGILCFITLMALLSHLSLAADHSSGQIMGRVFFDLDHSGDWTDGDKAVSKARIITDRGMEIITGQDGRFHVSNILAGRETRAGRVFVLDRSSVPLGTTVEGGWRRLVQVSPSGLPERVDFLLSRRLINPSDLKHISIGRARSPGTLVPSSNGVVLTTLKGVVPVGCVASMDGQTMSVGDDREFAIKVKVKRGINQHLLLLQCNDGNVQLSLARIHRIRRSDGGDLIVFPRLVSLGTCLGPRWDRVPKTSEIELSCLLRKDVQLTIQNKKGFQDASLTRFVSTVTHGDNKMPMSVRLPDGSSLWSMLKWKVQEAHLLGTLYGVVALGLDGKDPFIAGRLGGFLEWTLAEGFKLIIGSGLDLSELQGQSYIDVVSSIIDPTYDEKRFQRAEDPENSWIEHADESRIQDVNPTRSRYMVQLTRKGSFLGWGGFTTDQNMKEHVGRWSRAVDGGHGVIRPLEDFIDREKVDLELSGFWSPALSTGSDFRTVGAHEEFLATGGTLYFLGHGLVREGSERVEVERRDVYSGMVISSKRLLRDFEYQVDWTSGRLMLTEPLDSGNMGALRLSVSAASDSVLVVEYEYLDTVDSIEKAESIGGTVKIEAQPIDGVFIGGKFGVLKSGDKSPYELLRSELNFSLGRDSRGNSRIWARWAASSGVALTPSYSVDGGISLFGSQNPVRSQGEAYELGANFEYSGFKARGVFRRYLAGYSDTSYLAPDDVNQGGVWLSTELAQGLVMQGHGSALRMWSGDLWSGALGLKWSVFDALNLSFQAYYEGAFPEISSTIDAPFEEVFGQGQGLVLGARGSWSITPSFSIIAAHQQHIWSDGSGRVNRNLTMSTLGVQIQCWDDFSLGLEAGWGPETGTVLGLGLNSSDDGKRAMFAHTTVSVDRSGINDGWFAGGQNGIAENGWIVSSTQTMQDHGWSEALGQKTSISIPLKKNIHLKLAYERSELHQARNESLQHDMFLAPFFHQGIILSRPSRRNAVFGRLGWFGQTLAISAAAEYRVDEHLPRQDFQQLKTLAATSIHQTVLRLATRWTPLDGLALTGRLAWAETMEAIQESQTIGAPSGGFIEGSIGAAWRPAGIDWLRMIFRASIVKEQRPGQFTVSQPQMGQETYLSSSLAAAFYPTKYLQPTLVLAPWFSVFDFKDHRDSIHDRGLVGMLRVGSEIWAGLGMSVEVRTALGDRDFTLLPEVQNDLKVGLAGEVFYSIQGQDMGAVRFSVGYSFSSIPDPLMTELMTGGRGLFFRLEGML